jgi:hypothetical protein
MKGKAIVILLLLLCVRSSADDTYFFLASGGLKPMYDEETSVLMESETIEIELFSDYYTVEAEFRFRNDGERESLRIGFPNLTMGQAGRGQITDFRTWVNDTEVKTYVEDVDQRWNLETRFMTAYVKGVIFPAGSYTTTRVSYRATYGRESRGWIVGYLYGTGSSWKGPIGQMEVVIVNNGLWIHDLEIAGERPDQKWVEWKGENRLVITLTNIEPLYNDVIEMVVGGPIYSRGPVAFPHSYRYDKRLIPRDDLVLLNSSQLRILRNLIFAVHGYRFRSADLQEYFGREDWYQPSDSFSDSVLSDFERQNIALIQEFEAQRKQ